MIPHFFSDSGIPITFPWRETTAIKKQKNGARSISHLFRQLRYLPGDQKIDSENINALLLGNVEEQKRNIEMPKGTRLGKLNRILHSTKFKEQVCFKFRVNKEGLNYRKYRGLKH